MTDKMDDVLTQERTVVWLNQSEQSLDKEKLTTAGNELISEIQPAESRFGRFIWQLTARLNQPRATSLGTLVGALTGAVLVVTPVVVGSLSVQVGIYQNFTHLISGPKLLPESRARFWTNLFLLVCTGAITGTILYKLSKRGAPTPTHGSTVSLVMATSGDGTVDVGYLADKQTRTALKQAIEKIASEESLTPGETVTYRECLGFDTLSEETETEIERPWPSDRTPYLAEIRYRERQPFDGLVEGETARRLVAGNSDTGLPPDNIIGLLAEFGVPCVVQITATARRPNSGRRKALTDRLSWVINASKGDAEWADNPEITQTARPLSSADGPSATDVPSLTDLYDVSVRLLVFADDDGDAAARLAKSVANSYGAPTNDYIETVEHIARVDRHCDFRLGCPYRVAPLLDRFDEDSVAFRGAYRFYGLVAGCGQHTRTALPATPQEIWRHLAVTGDGLAAAKRGQGTTNRDQTEAGEPAETHLQEMRLNKSVDELFERADADDANAATDTDGDDASPTEGASDIDT